MRNPVCNLCNRYQAASTVCLYGQSISNPIPDIMIVTDNVNSAQDNTGSLLMGQGANTLVKLLTKTNIINRAYVTAAVKCNASHKPNAKEIKACQVYLYKEIEELKPKLIICMGAMAIKSVFDKQYNLKDLRQRFFVAHNTQVACTFSYNVVFTDPAKLVSLEKDLIWIMSNWNKPARESEYQFLIDQPLEDSNVYGIDIESTGLNVYTEDILTIAIANPRTKTSIGYNISHPGSKIHHAIRKNVVSEKITLVGHNIKFDVKFLEQKSKTKITNKLIDTAIAHAMIDENSMDNSLKALASIYTNLGHYEDDIAVTNLIKEPFETVIKYNQLDSIVPLLLMEKFYPELKKQGLLKIFNFVTNMIPVFVEMEQLGTQINMSKVIALRQKNELIVQAIKNKYIKIDFGKDGSTKAVKDVIYKTLKCPVLTRSKKSNIPSTSKDSLNELISHGLDEHQEIFINDLLEFRKAKKNVDHLEEILTYTHNGRVHTEYNLAKAFDESGTLRGTVTGRLSSSKANLQNKPPEVREVFEKSNDFIYFVTADYSQIELRMAAFLSREPNLIKAFMEGRDVHTSVMCDITNQDYNRIHTILQQEDHKEYKKWHDYRLAVKRVNFGIMYGIQANHLVKLILQMGVKLTSEQTKSIINQWYLNNSVLMQWIRNTEDHIIVNGMYRTITGRIRHLPGASRKSEAGHRVLRQGINFPIQSPASDVCLLGIRNLYNLFHSSDFPKEYESRLLLTVHDEISYETKIPDENLIKHMTRKMLIDNVRYDLLNEFNINFDIPLDIDVKIGTYWKK